MAALPPSALVHAAVAGHIGSFRSYLETSEFKTQSEIRDARIRYFQQELPQRLAMFNNTDLESLVRQLWAFKIWGGSKQYLLRKILFANKLDDLGAQLKRLLDAAQPVSDRYEFFLKETVSFGPSATSEMLCYCEPNRCGIWNGKAREALGNLKLGEFIALKGNRMDGQEYKAFNQVLKGLGGELSSAGVAAVDLYTVNLFLHMVGGGV